MIKEFLMKKMLQSQLKNVPQAEQDKILKMVEKNPGLFMKIAQEVKQKMKEGKDQTASAIEVMQSHAEEFKALM